MKILLIPAAGNPTNPLTTQWGLVSDAFLPVNGKPVLDWTIRNALKYSIDKIFILANPKSYKKFKDFINLHYFDMSNIELYSLDSHSLAQTIRYGLAKVRENLPNNLKNITHAYIVLGDTIYLGDFISDSSATHNIVAYRTDYKIKTRWTICEIGGNGRILNFYDKVSNLNFDSNGNYVVSGFFIIRDLEEFYNALDNTDDLYRALLRLSPVAREIKHVYDCGHIDNYYKTRKELISTRFFNNIEYNDRYQTITKRSSKQEGLRKELQWYLSIPKQLQTFTPKIVGYSLNPVYYTMEYYGYATLQDYAITNSLHLDIWKTILSKLIDVHKCFSEFKVERSISDLISMYKEKTERRIGEIQSPKIKELIKKDKITINGKSYSGFLLIKDKIFEKLNHLINIEKRPFTIIHGDFCFNNILFDLNNNIVKLIDPRGSFGKKDIYGDPCYDIAKLRHSIHGSYEFIINDLFELKEYNNNSFKFNISSKLVNLVDYFDNMVSKYYNLDYIKLIEGLLFISMLPIHSNSEKRQIAMYLTAIMILNEILNN